MTGSSQVKQRDNGFFLLAGQVFLGISHFLPMVAIALKKSISIAI